MPFPRPGVYSKRSWSLGRKLGAVLAFVVGGAVAGASGIMLFAPETPGAFALAPPPPANEPVIPTVVAVAPADAVTSPSAAKTDSLGPCLRGSTKCEGEAKSDQPAAASDDRKLGTVRAATDPAAPEAAKPVAALSAPEIVKPVASTTSPVKVVPEAVFPAIFLAPRAIASVAPTLVTTMPKAVPSMFLVSRPIASTSYPLTSPALPALAARAKSVVTTAVALPAAAETPPAAEQKPVKPRKTAKTQNNRRNDYYHSRQNFFSFFRF